jgi:hypothetical protein
LGLVDIGINKYLFNTGVGKFCQNYRQKGPHDSKNLKKYTQNIKKWLIFDSSLGRRLANPAFISLIYNIIFHLFERLLNFRIRIDHFQIEISHYKMAGLVRDYHQWKA